MPICTLAIRFIRPQPDNSPERDNPCNSTEPTRLYSGAPCQSALQPSESYVLNRSTVPSAITRVTVPSAVAPGLSQQTRTNTDVNPALPRSVPCLLGSIVGRLVRHARRLWLFVAGHTSRANACCLCLPKVCHYSSSNRLPSYVVWHSLSMRVTRFPGRMMHLPLRARD